MVRATARRSTFETPKAQRLLLPAIETEAETPTPIPSAATRSVAYQTDGADGTYVRLLSSDGDVLYQSPNFSAHKRFRPSLPATATEVAYNHTWEAAPAHEWDSRWVAAPFQSRSH